MFRWESTDEVYVCLNMYIQYEYVEINHFSTEELIKLNMDFIKKRQIRNVPDFPPLFFCTIPVMKRHFIAYMDVKMIV